jgi:predicted HNH restriction endonuclease
MSLAFDLLNESQKRDVRSECLACLAYFATVSGRSGRTKIQKALADATRNNETPLLKSRINWWSSKLANIQYSFYYNGLNGKTLHGLSTKLKKGKGRSGLSKDQEGRKLSKAQKRIKEYALNYFINQLEYCKTLAREYLEPSRILPTEIEKALFEFIAVELNLENDPDAQIVLELKSHSPEGALKLVTHLKRERNVNLARLAKSEFLKNNKGRLFCQSCGIEPIKVYGTEVIEVHHILPLSKSDEDRVTEIKDLMMLCPNCHRAVHRQKDCDINEVIKNLGTKGVNFRHMSE